MSDGILRAVDGEGERYLGDYFMNPQQRRSRRKQGTEFEQEELGEPFAAAINLGSSTTCSFSILASQASTKAIQVARSLLLILGL